MPHRQENKCVCFRWASVVVIDSVNIHLFRSRINMQYNTHHYYTNYQSNRYTMRNFNTSKWVNCRKKKNIVYYTVCFQFLTNSQNKKKMVIRTSQLVINKFVTSPNCWSYIRYTDMYDVRGSVKAKTIDSIDEQCIVSKCTFNAHWQDMHSEIAVVCCRLIISTE